MRTAIDMAPQSGSGRLPAAALELFRRNGYERSTLAEIAGEAGLTERQLQEEFATKEALVAELTRPMLHGLDSLVRTAADTDSYDPDELAKILGAYLGVLVEHRELIDVLLGDPTAADCPAVGRLRGGLAVLRDELAGPAGGLDERIRASSALGAVQRAVADFTDLELLDCRAVIIEAAVAILVAR